VLRVLRAKQRTRLQAVLEHCTLEQDQVLWHQEGKADAAWLLDDAVVEFHEEAHAPVVLGRAAFVGDVEAILRGRGLASRAQVIRGGGAFRITAAQLAQFLEESPALMLALSGAQFVS
jgi:hypothetical protein